MLFQLFHLHSDCLKELLEAYKHQYISIKSYADVFLNISTFLHVNVYDICAIPNLWVHIGMQGCVCVLVPGIFLAHSHLIYGSRIFHLKPDWLTRLVYLVSCSGHPISVSPGRRAATPTMRLYGLLGSNSQICTVRALAICPASCLSSP